MACPNKGKLCINWDVCPKRAENDPRSIELTRTSNEGMWPMVGYDYETREVPLYSARKVTDDVDTIHAEFKADDGNENIVAGRVHDGGDDCGSTTTLPSTRGLAFLGWKHIGFRYLRKWKTLSVLSVSTTVHTTKVEGNEFSREIVTYAGAVGHLRSFRTLAKSLMVAVRVPIYATEMVKIVRDGKTIEVERPIHAVDYKRFHFEEDWVEHDGAWGYSCEGITLPLIASYPNSKAQPDYGCGSFVEMVRPAKPTKILIKVPLEMKRTHVDYEITGYVDGNPIMVPYDVVEDEVECWLLGWVKDDPSKLLVKRAKEYGRRIKLKEYAEQHIIHRDCVLKVVWVLGTTGERKAKAHARAKAQSAISDVPFTQAKAKAWSAGIAKVVKPTKPIVTQTLKDARITRVVPYIES